jgi:hypothetical protein
MTKIIDQWMQRWMWFAHLTILLAVAIVATYAADRAVPFKMLEVDPAFEVTAGKPATLRAKVWRDPTRPCAASFSRYIFDSTGARFYLDASFATAAMIQSMERSRPGELVLTVDMPTALAAGPARLVTALQYRCNKVHSLWPIEVTTELPFTVRP